MKGRLKVDVQKKQITNSAVKEQLFTTWRASCPAQPGKVPSADLEYSSCQFCDVSH